MKMAPLEVAATVDDTALVGSGNLTDDAFNRNMELGLLIGSKTTANAIYNHFMSLIAQSELKLMDTRPAGNP